MNGRTQTPAVDTTQVFALQTDAQGHITQANNALLHRLGFRAQELIGKNLSQLQHSDLPPAIMAEIWQRLQAARPWLGLLKIKTATGQAVWFNTTVAASQSGAGNGQYQWIFRNAKSTDIKQAEAAYRKLRSGKGTHQGVFARLSATLNDLPIGKRITFGFSLLTMLVAGGLTLEALINTRSLIDSEEHAWLNKYAQTVNTSIQNNAAKATALAAAVSAYPEVRAAFIKRDRQALLAETQQTFAVLKKDYGVRQMQFHTPDAHSFLRLHKPSKYGDDLSAFRATVVKANQTLRPVSGLEKGKAGFGIRGVVPMLAGQQGIGTVEVGMGLDQGFLEGFKRKHHVEVGVYVPNQNQIQTIGSTFGQPLSIQPAQIQQVLSGTPTLSEATFGDHAMSLLYSPLKDFSGKTVGMLVLGRDHSDYQAMMAEKRNLLLLVGFGAILLSIGVSIWISRSIAHPIGEAVQISKNIAAGQYDNPIDIRRNDETGALLETMGTMQALLAYKLFEEHETSEANRKVKIALDYISTNVTVSNTEGHLIFMNKACQTLFNALGQQQSRGQAFRAEELIGKSLAKDFFNDPKLREIFSNRLSVAQEATFSSWGHTFKLFIHPVIDAQGEYQGRVTQWTDITVELTAEQEIEHIVSAANQGDLSQRVSLEHKEGFFKLLAVNLNALLDGIENVISDIDSTMQRLAVGDLTSPIDKRYAGTFESVKSSVNTTIRTLQSMIGELRNATTDVNNSALQISHSNEQLSERTEKQGASLENTAASLEEITGTVSQNAENAHLATDLAVQAQKVSKQGVEVVHQAIDAMGSINASSSKIEEIISVIDEIAFQTNLLALNAAVEAARAGEMGRGFAVVANEVRALAGRSSDAAKEIKVLITDSVEKVHNGSELVNKTGTALDEITGSIEKVNSIMAEIASANQEQSIGISQINHSVTQLDEATQQNTALAQQTATVAESLKQQAQAMEQGISRFQLPAPGQSADGSAADQFLRAV